MLSSLQSSGGRRQEAATGHGRRKNVMTQRFGCHSRYSTLLLCGAASVVALSLSLVAANAQVQKIGDPPEAHNMRLVGFNDLQARSAYQPLVVHEGSRYIAYLRHHGSSAEMANPLNPLTRQRHHHRGAFPH